MTFPEPLEFEFTVDCPVEHAFDTWTTRINSWWPKDHTAGRNPEVVIVFESEKGGRIFERADDGRELDWGRVTTWDPPTGLGYTWHIDGGEPTQVDISFTAVGSTTEVQIVHSGWHRLSDAAELRHKANSGGWSGVLEAYRTEMNG